MRFMRHSRTTAIGLLLALVLTACVTTSVRQSPAEIAAAHDAAALTQQGQFDQAAQAYLALAAQNSGYADVYRLLAAEAWRQEGRLEQAAPTLAVIKRARLTGDEPLRLDLLQAELALDQNNAASALQLTLQPNTVVPEVLQLRLLELRARSMAATGDNWGAARTRVEMDDRLSGFDRSQNRRQALTLFTKVDVGSLQQRAAAMKPGDRMLSWVNEALTQLGIAVAAPTPELQQPVGTLLPGADANVREGYKVPERIALLLPAEGSSAAAAGPVREGFFSAYIDAARNHAPRPIVRSYNSHGTADGAIAAYQQAVSDGAQLVVGPLTRNEVAALFSLPQLPVPLLTLNHPEDRQLPAGETSEFGLMPETEGTQAAEHMAERGLRSAYIVVSSDDFAQRAADAFKAEWAAQGHQLVGMVTLPSGETSYANAISALNLAQASGNPDTDANAPPSAGIFISMRPAQAQLLVPQLRIAQVTTPVFATSHIYAGSDDPTANRDLDGVEFCDAPWLFDAQPGLPNHADIAARLPAAGGGAGRLFAFGMDAWHLVPYLDWMRTHPGTYLPGASGQLVADQFGRVRRVLIWAKFQDGIARPLSGSLQLDDTPPANASSTGDGQPFSG